MPTDTDFPDYGGLGEIYGDLGNYDLDSIIYGDPAPLEIDYFGDGGKPEEDPVMYFDQITTTTVPPDMYDYLFAFDKPSRNRISGPVRKKFDAQALKAAYAALLQTSKTEEKARRITRSIFEDARSATRSLFEDVEVLARQFLQKFTGVKPKVLGLLDRRAPIAFRQNTFVKISLAQFSIVSTGTTGKTKNFNTALES